MPKPFETTAPLLDDAGRPAGPVVHVSRPEDDPPGRRYGRRARWLVVDAAGKWLAAGFVDVYRSERFSNRVECETKDLVPVMAWSSIVFAVARALQAWDEIERREATIRERLGVKRANLEHARKRREDLDREIASLEDEIRSLETDLSENP
jgi:hypothetical protein